jgi:hypothetical protein
VGRSEWGNTQNFNLGLSSRTVALWFYILVFDHNATDTAVQKRVAIYGADILDALWECIFPHSRIVQANIFCSLYLDISYYQSVN